MPQELAGLIWHVDELIQFRRVVWVTGWASHRERPVTAVHLRFGDGDAFEVDGYGAPRADAREHGARDDACGFSVEVRAPNDAFAGDLRLVCTLDDGAVIEVDRLYIAGIDVDPYHDLQRRFFAWMAERPAGRVLEIGSRARSGEDRRDRVPSGWSYTGLDILEGPNVDVVGDAHDLRRHFPKRAFDAVFALSVFEHLVMPWKVAIEVNRVLARGGRLMVVTHQTFPLHDIPWDFWRFSNDGWKGLFNPVTGFAIVDVAMGEQAHVAARLTHEVTRGMEDGLAFLGAAVVAEKTNDTRLRWDVTLRDAVSDDYPA